VSGEVREQARDEQAPQKICDRGYDVRSKDWKPISGAERRPCYPLLARQYRHYSQI